jgi:AraC-like DNA-binding protein
MGKRRQPHAVHWLLREGGSERPVPASSLLTFNDEHWTASIERIDIGDSLRVFLTEAEIRRGLSLEPLQSVTGVWLSSKVAIRGRVAVSFSDGAHVELTPDRSMLCRPHDGKARFTPKPRQRLHLAGYMLRADRVESLCDGKVPAAIRPLIAPTTDRDLLLKIPTTAPLRRAAIKLFSNPFVGKLREVYLEGLALQMFALQSAAAGDEAKSRSNPVLSAAERKALARAHARLLADLANPPTVAELAADAGMSERRLNAGFKALFGTTVFELLRKERLEHARLVLESEALPLKLVAERVGYRHVTNFINAFAARYGTPPRQFADGQTDTQRQPRARSRSKVRSRV